MHIFDLGSHKAEIAQQAFELSEELISEYLTLLREGVCLQISTSHGKDSTSITNAAIEAMGQALAEGIIEKDHPLVILTVDTLLEPEPIQCYVDFAHQNVIKRCEELGINLKAKIVSPPFHHQLMILFANAQKLFATASSGRSADCSKIFKVDTNIRALKDIKASLPEKYQQAPWVSVAGQRSDESHRRSHNMTKQGVKSLKAKTLLEQINKEGVTSKVYRFAPISDWIVDDVIAYLTHAGSGVHKKCLPGQEIKCYGENFGLLLAIYGEGSNERCELVTSADDKQKQSGCGKLARFGCVTCGMVSEDKSAKELNEYTRWSRFGDATLRFRDYLTRVSDDINCRAFHARAFDRSCNNNVFLQPNVLKASVLEKLVWYASQITIDSLNVHLEFTKLYESGHVESDVGIKDIMQDNTITASVRKQYVEMYTNRMLKGPMFELFSHKHAVLLSLLWSLHGITALPYRPIAIWDAVLKGKRLPYPLTNSELNAKRAHQGLISFQDELRSQSIPDAVVAQIFTPSKHSFKELKSIYGEKLNSTHLKPLLPFSLSEYWQDASVQVHQHHDLQLFNKVTSANIRKVRLTYRLDAYTGDDFVSAKCLQSSKAIDLKANKAMLDLCLELARNNYVQNGQLAVLENNRYELVSDHQFSDQVLFTSKVAHYSEQKRVKTARTRQFSERKRVLNKLTGKYVAGRASLKMYSVNERSSEVEQRINNISYWLPDHTVNETINVGTAELDSRDLSLNFIFDDYLFELWLQDGGIARLLQHHDTLLRNRIKDRKPIRVFYGTGPVYKITNTSGLSVSKRLEGNFVSTLKRTEVFHKSGVFDLANLNQDAILSYKNVISMNDHRAQKVDHLLAARYIKHIERREMKHCLANAGGDLGLMSMLKRLNEFTDHYLIISKRFIAAQFYGSFQTDAALRAAKLGMWLNEYSLVMSDPAFALKTLATKEEAENITGNFDTYNVFLKEYSVIIKALKVTLTAFPLASSKALSELLRMADGNDLEIFTVDGSYQAGGQTKALIADIAQFVSSNMERVNYYVVESYVTQIMAYVAHKNYLGHGIISDISSANTLAKKQLRYEKSIHQLKQALSASMAVNHQCLLGVLTVNPLDWKAAANKQLTATVKTAKLASLMKQNINQFNALLSAS